jgi:hypothetical protein
MWWRADDTHEGKNDLTMIKKELIILVDSARESFSKMAIEFRTAKNRNSCDFDAYLKLQGLEEVKNIDPAELGGIKRKSFVSTFYSTDRFIYDACIESKNTYIGANITEFNKNIRAIKEKVDILSRQNGNHLSEEDSQLIGRIKQVVEELPKPVVEPALLFAENKAPNADEYVYPPTEQNHLSFEAHWERSIVGRLNVYFSYKDIFASDKHFDNLNNLKKLLTSKK